MIRNYFFIKPRKLHVEENEDEIKVTTILKIISNEVTVTGLGLYQKTM